MSLRQRQTSTDSLTLPKLQASGYSSFHSCVEEEEEEEEEGSKEGRKVDRHAAGRTDADRASPSSCAPLAGGGGRGRTRGRTDGRGRSRSDCHPSPPSKLEKLSPT